MSRITALLPLILIAAGSAAESALPFAGEPPWDATYDEVGVTFTTLGWEVWGDDGDTLFAASGPLELTFRWDEAGFMTGVTFIERWGDEADSLEAFTTWRDELSEGYGDPVELREGYALWTSEGCDVALELDEIYSVGGRSPVVFIRYKRNES